MRRAIVKVLQSVCDEGRERTRRRAGEPFIMSDHRSLRRVIDRENLESVGKYIA